MRKETYDPGKGSLRRTLGGIWVSNSSLADVSNVLVDVKR